MSDPMTISEQSTVTIGLLVGSIGTLIVATRAFVNLSNKVDYMAKHMVSRAEVEAALLRLARDNPGFNVSDFATKEPA